MSFFSCPRQGLQGWVAVGADPDLIGRLKKVVNKGGDAEMCQVSMKLFDGPLQKLVAGFKPTGRPVAVKRIADLQRDGYIYLKP